MRLLGNGANDCGRQWHCIGATVNRHCCRAVRNSIQHCRYGRQNTTVCLCVCVQRVRCAAAAAHARCTDCCTHGGGSRLRASATQFCALERATGTRAVRQQDDATMQRCNNRTTAQLKPATVYVRLRQYDFGRAYHGVVRRAVSRRSVQCRSAAVDARLDAALRCAAITARGRHGVRVLQFAAMHGVRCMVYVAWCTLHGVHCTQVDAAHAAIGGGDVGARADGASASDSAQARRVAQGGSADR